MKLTADSDGCKANASSAQCHERPGRRERFWLFLLREIADEEPIYTRSGSACAELPMDLAFSSAEARFTGEQPMELLVNIS